MPNSERFDNPLTVLNATSSLDLYKQTNDPASFDKAINMNYKTLSDYITGIMIYKRCYAMPNKKLEDLMPMLKNFPNAYSKQFGVYTNNFKDIQQKIIDTLDTFRMNQPSQMIKGDVYVLLTQQPYYKNDDGTMISLDAITLNDRGYGFTPKNINKQVKDTNPIYYTITLVFSAYKPDGTFVYCANLFQYIIDAWDRTYYSKENQCFLQCIDDSKFCGCATGTATGMQPYASGGGGTPYSSMCLGPQLKDDGVTPDYTKPKQLPTTYLSLYIINKDFVNNMFQCSINDGTCNKIPIFDKAYPCQLVNNNPNPTTAWMTKFFA